MLDLPTPEAPITTSLTVRIPGELRGVHGLGVGEQEAGVVGGREGKGSAYWARERLATAHWRLAPKRFAWLRGDGRFTAWPAMATAIAIAIASYDGRLDPA